MPSVTGRPSFWRCTTLASPGPARPSLATNSPDSRSSLLIRIRTAICACRACSDHARYLPTPRFVLFIIRMYFMVFTPRDFRADGGAFIGKSEPAGNSRHRSQNILQVSGCGGESLVAEGLDR